MRYFKSKYNFNILLITVIVFSLFKIWHKLFELFKPDNYFTKHNTSGSNISDATAQAYADSLHVSMGSLGTDENTIFNIIRKLDTQPNYNKVYNQFKLRKYIDTTGQGSELIGVPFNLNQWLNSEISDSFKKNMLNTTSIIF